MAALEYRGANAVTNFDVSNYIERLKKKGIPIERILQMQLPNAEAEVEQPPEVSSPQLQCIELPAPSMDTPTMIAMDPIEEHELTWSFCMDSGLNPLPMPELPLGNACELPNLFDDTGFEDNIDLIFDTCCYGNDTNPEFVSDNAGCGVEVVGVSGSMEEENGKERLLSSSSMSNSPSCSTTTSVSCNSSV